jgi:hypothetical protein
MVSSRSSACLSSGSISGYSGGGTKHCPLFAKGYLEYLVHVMNYTYIMTDKQPDIMPVVVKIFEA